MKKYKNKKILITGAAGFIGSHLAEKSIEKGYEVIALDNLSKGKVQNLHNIISHLEFIKGDITDGKLLRQILPRVDYIFHAAALIDARESQINPDKYFYNNSYGTYNLISHMCHKNKLILASSAAVYGKSDQINHERGYTLPCNYYGISKLFCECFTKNTNTVILRYANVYGKRNNGSVIAKFIDKIKNNESPLIFGDGKQIRNFVHVDDVVNANFIALRAPIGRIYNVCSDRHVNLLELLDIIKNYLKSNLNATFLPPADGDIVISKMSNKMLKQLKWKEEWSLEERLKELCISDNEY